MANRTISSGHGKKVAGASYYIDEVTEARKVVNRVTEICEQLDPKGTIKYHEDSASNKNSNLNNIVKYHNSTNRALDVSIHFNSAKFKDKNGEYKLECTDSAVGTETLYKTQAGKVWAAKITTAIASAGGFEDRGIVHRTNLGFLNNTNKPAILIELCFVNSKKDVELYKKNFEAICIAIAEVLTGKTYTNSTKPLTFKNGDYSGRKAKVTATSLNVRYDRGTRFDVIGKLKKGDVVILNYCLNGWISIEGYKGNKGLGYVSTDCLELI